MKKPPTITGGEIKHTCCICYKENGDESKKNVVLFPFSKFRTWGAFCEKHEHEIRNNNQLHNYEKLFNL
jgi:hypothetical protein